MTQVYIIRKRAPNEAQTTSALIYDDPGARRFFSVANQTKLSSWSNRSEFKPERVGYTHIQAVHIGDGIYVEL